VNPTFLSCLLFGFGGLGVLCRFLKMETQQSLIWAAAGGLGFYMFAYMFVGKVFGAGTATSHNRRDSLVGLRAQVTAPIDGSRPGMVSYTVSGARQSLRAITDDEEAIPSGAMVRIRKVEANTVHVMRIDG
jgi:membrane protein implicated in regulation of membrane protease activity